jgi:hypothetical protein
MWIVREAISMGEAARLYCEEMDLLDDHDDTGDEIVAYPEHGCHPG